MKEQTYMPTDISTRSVPFPSNIFVPLLTCTLVLFLIFGCQRVDHATTHQLKGMIKLDGSSTVFPLSAAVAEDFQTAYPGVRVTVGLSGTGGGFKRFIAGELDITNASRPIKNTERAKLAKQGMKYIELPVAYDGIAVVVNARNTFVTSLSVAQLKRLWQADSDIITWKDLDPKWPDETISFYSPGADSGTFDYFTKVINGKEKSIRTKNLNASEDDNQLVVGVSGDLHSIGYFGYAYYAENRDKLKLVPVDNGAGPIKPNPQSIENGTYTPLARPIFIYARLDALRHPQIDTFVTYYLEHARRLAVDVGYVPLAQNITESAQLRYRERLTGTLFAAGVDPVANLSKRLREKGKL